MLIGPIRTTVDQAAGCGVLGQDLKVGWCWMDGVGFIRACGTGWYLLCMGFSFGSVVCGWVLFCVMGCLVDIVLVTMFFVVFSDF